MAQRILMIALIIVIVMGGGLYAYRELVPPPVQEAQGPIYSTKPVTRGDISVGVEVSGPLNPSRSGSIMAPGGRNYYEIPSSNIQYTLVEILAEEGTAVKMGQVIARLAAPELHTQIKNAEDELKSEKRFLSELTGLPEERLHEINPAQGVVLRAPIDGRVSGLSVSEGKEVKQGHIVARIVDDSHFKINAKVYPDEFAHIKLNQELALRFSAFDGIYYGKVTDINPNPVPDGNEESPAKGFVYWITVEGKNPGLVTPGLEVYLGVPSSTNNSSQVLWFKNPSTVESFVDEERVLSTVEAMATQVHVREMQMVKKGDPIVSLSGSDVQQTLEERLEKIRRKESELAELYSKAGQMEVRAPMDGVIARWETQIGAQIQPGEWMGYVFNTSDMSMWVEVDDIDVLMIKQGSPVTVTVEALPGETFEGVVEHVSTMGKDMQGITRFGVEIRVQGGPNLKPGMQASAYIDAGSAKDVLLIPLEAIFEEDGAQKVEVLNPDGTTKVATVKLGLMNDRYAEVKSGLQEGELVITGSSADLLPSQHIGNKNSILPSQNNDSNNNDQQKTPAAN
ncbi:MAG TPA: efflux RND transporter periplasmic adaptor subunit [Thermoanaerobacterales bacterium]|uniref:efflux RND transporter periplasmic adaptor subunit n=1 Tax=Tepidanaerobacter sp. GT38 TaxID=2722793 RepID=UPI0018143F56|nr:efflux RND transporter periplasmic adaptor subunit [Tepidanaerobacter sp. GT38]MCG1011356.1 efflux RND transporter periplasmic adaptor subunit [Tepidanaerobacter sp. GT38]HHY41385.1 efflux RND transporter periplasmic adaptor subunit [Thermoanaerobacterales bacterium]